MPIELVADMLDRVRDNRPLHSLEAELAAVPLANARQIGLPEAWTQRLAQHNATHRQVLSIVRMVGGSPLRSSCSRGTCCWPSTVAS